MARPKKKNSDPSLSMQQLLNKAVDLFQEPYDDRDERESSLPSLRAVADQLYRNNKTFSMPGTTAYVMYPNQATVAHASELVDMVLSGEKLSDVDLK